MIPVKAMIMIPMIHWNPASQQRAGEYCEFDDHCRPGLSCGDDGTCTRMPGTAFVRRVICAKVGDYCEAEPEDTQMGDQYAARGQQKL